MQEDDNFQVRNCPQMDMRLHNMPMHALTMASYRQKRNALALFLCPSLFPLPFPALLSLLHLLGASAATVCSASPIYILHSLIAAFLPLMFPVKGTLSSLGWYI